MAKAFAAGEKADTSGIYRVVHEHQHVPAHYVLVIEDDTFPN